MSAYMEPKITNDLEYLEYLIEASKKRVKKLEKIKLGLNKIKADRLIEKIAYMGGF